MDNSDITELDRAIMEASQSGQLRCAAALALARRMGMEPVKVGERANALGVKITGCQLGCFP